MKKNLILIGGGGHCKSCIDVIELENKYKIIGILDRRERLDEKVLGYSIIGTDDDIKKFVAEKTSFLITVGQIRSPETRIAIYKLIKKHGAELAIIKSPLAYISRHARIDEGTIVMHFAMINAGAKVGKNNIINTRALLEHDVTVGDHCHVSTGAIVNGGARIENYCFLGSAAVCIQNTIIPESSFIKANSIVKKSR